jgi:hypothetical protein
LARAMVDTLLGWLPTTTKVRLLLDSGYMNRTMLRGLPREQVTIFGAIKTNAALYRPPPSAAPKRRGRRRKKGERMATPAKMHHDRRRAWTTMTVKIGLKKRRQRVLSVKAQWYGVLGEFVARVVLVDHESSKLRVFLCTDAEQPAEAVLEQVGRRWSIEVWNRDIKQDFGFADSPAWSETAVRRTAPWAGLLSGMLVIWFHRVHSRVEVSLPERPWYSWKHDLSFADLVRTARATLRTVELVGWARAVASGETPDVVAALQDPSAGEPSHSAVAPCSTDADQNPMAA